MPSGRAERPPSGEDIRVLLNRKVDVRLPGKRNSNSHGARPVHLIKWIRTSRLAINKSLRGCGAAAPRRPPSSSGLELGFREKTYLSASVALHHGLLSLALSLSFSLSLSLALSQGLGFEL